MFEKEEPQIFEENKKEGYSVEKLKEIIEKKIEICRRGNKEENQIIEISEELRDAIVVYLYNNSKIKGLKEKPLLYFEDDGCLYLTSFEGKFLAWPIEDEEIIKKIEELIS